MVDHPKQCPNCGGKLEMISAPLGILVGCQNATECGWTKSFLYVKNELEFDPYNIPFSGRLDPYVIADIYGLDGMQLQALKKLLRNGRKHKTEEEDMDEVISTLVRRKEIIRGRQERASQGIPTPQG